MKWIFEISKKQRKRNKAEKRKMGTKSGTKS